MAEFVTLTDLHAEKEVIINREMIVSIRKKADGEDTTAITLLQQGTLYVAEDLEEVRRRLRLPSDVATVK